MDMTMPLSVIEPPSLIVLVYAHSKSSNVVASYV